MRMQALRQLLSSHPDELVELLASLGTKPTLKPSGPQPPAKAQTPPAASPSAPPAASGGGVEVSDSAAASSEAAPEAAGEPAAGGSGGGASATGAGAAAAPPTATASPAAGVDVAGIEALAWFATRLLCSTTSRARGQGLRPAAIAAPTLQAHLNLLVDSFKPPSS